MPRPMILAAAVAVFALTAGPGSAQQWGHWRTIAFKTVNGGTDVDRINVRSNNRYRQVRLCVYKAPLRMRDFDIRFENGQRQDVRVRQLIGADMCTRNIDLHGDRRRIDWIRLKYERIARGMQRPLVRVQVR